MLVIRELLILGAVLAGVASVEAIGFVMLTSMMRRSDHAGK